MSLKRFAAQYAKKHGLAQKQDRYQGNRKERRVLCDGYWFDSDAERELYLYLKAEMQAEKFTEIVCQDRLKLSDAQFIMIPDFKVTLPDGSCEWHEMKGNIITDQFKRNTRLWKAGYGPFPGAKLTVWKIGRRGLYVWKLFVDPRTTEEDSDAISE